MKRSFTLEVRTAPLDALDEAAIEGFASALVADKVLAGPATGGDLLTRVLSVRTSIDARTAEEAFAKALPRIRSALRLAGVGTPELTEAALQLDLAGDRFFSARDDVVGTPEVARRLGISRERVRQLAEVPGRFPSPIGSVRDTRVWHWGDVADWLAAGGRRRAGRPRAAGGLARAGTC